MMMEKEVDVDGIQRHLGTGRFQILAFIALGLIYSRGAWHVFGIMFLAGDPGHKCALPYANYNTDIESSSLSPLHDLWHYSDTTSGPNRTGNDSNVANSPAVTISPHQKPEDDKDVAKTNWTAEVCSVSYVTENGSSITVVKDCPFGWSYGSEFETTVLSEWNLVCEKNFLVELSMTIFMVGAMMGAMLILPLADRFGRKRLMMVCLLCQTCIGTAIAFVNNYTVFTVLRFILGMVNIGVGLCSFVLMTEIFPAHRRTVMSIAFQVFWAIGVMTVAGFGYSVRHWRHLELLLSLPNLLALPCFWLLPESLPWLISQKRWSEALTTITTIARINGKDAKDISHLVPSPNNSDNSSMESSSNQSRSDRNSKTENVIETEGDAMIGAENDCNGSSQSNGCTGAVSKAEDAASDLDPLRGVRNGRTEQLDSSWERSGTGDRKKKSSWTSLPILNIFRHPQMMRYSCIMFFLFFVSSLGYFGISFSVPVLHGNQFVNLFIMGAVEIPANVICVIVGQKIGRRYPNAMFFLLCGISNITAIFLPYHLEVVKLVFVMMGKFAITAAYSTIYLYSAEIFPTAIRNQAMGMSSVFENIGSISAPFIVLAAKSLPELPLVLFGVLTITGACLTLLLPETHNRPLPQTVQEITTW